MSVQLAPSPVFTGFGFGGLPVIGGTLSTFIAGTSTPQATYVDSTQTTPNANPIQLNANAQANVWLVQGLTYKLQLKDALGNQVWIVDQIPGGQVLTQASIGLLLYPPIASEGSNVVNPWYYYGNVLRYGAIGGGTVDDSAAFAAAAPVSALFPMTIPFIAGGFKVNTPVVLPANATVRGVDRPLVFSAVAGNHIMSATSIATITVDGVLFQGTNSSTPPTFGFGGFSSNNTGLLTCSNCTDVRITNCDFTQFYNCLTVQQCTRVWVKNNHISHWLSFGVLASVSSEFIIDENLIENCDQTGGVVAYGIHATGNSPSIPSQFNSISLNVIRNIPSWDAIGTHDIDGLRVIGNDCRNVRHGIDIGHLVSTNVVQNVIIANNYIEGPTSDTWGGANAEIGGIICEGFDSTHRVLRCSITGNQIANFFNVSGMVGGGFGAGCISVAYSDDVNVSGNIISNCGTATIATATGIIVSGTVNRLTINGNSFQGGSLVRGAIRFATVTADTVSIVGNIGVQTTTANNHIDISGSTITNLASFNNPSNSTAPYLETTSTITYAATAQSGSSGNTATAVSTGSTIPTSANFVRCTVAGASTGNILTAGLLPNQSVTVFNESGTNTITMAASGTSNVADGTSCVIAVNTQKTFQWDSGTSLWYHS